MFVQFLKSMGTSCQFISTCIFLFDDEKSVNVCALFLLVSSSTNALFYSPVKHTEYAFDKQKNVFLENLMKKKKSRSTQTDSTTNTNTKKQQTTKQTRTNSLSSFLPSFLFPPLIFLLVLDSLDRGLRAVDVHALAVGGSVRDAGAVGAVGALGRLRQEN